MSPSSSSLPAQSAFKGKASRSRSVRLMLSCGRRALPAPAVIVPRLAAPRDAKVSSQPAPSPLWASPLPTLRHCSAPSFNATITRETCRYAVEILIPYPSLGRFMTPRGKLTIDVLQDPETIAAFVPRWADVVLNTPGTRLFESPLWAMNYCRRSYKYAKDLRLLVARNRDDIAGVFPMSFTRGSVPPFTSTLSPVHSKGEYESGWFCQPGFCSEFADLVLDYLQDNRPQSPRLLASLIHEDAESLQSIKRQCEQRGFPYKMSQGMLVPFLQTSGQTYHIDETLDRKFFRELRRRERKLQTSKPLTYELHCQRSGIEEALKDFFSVEAAGWKGKSGTAIQACETTEKFWRALAIDAAEAGLLRLHLLRHGDTAIAGQFGIVFGRTYFCLKLGYDDGYRQFGPGALTTRVAIQHCIEAPDIDVYDFAGQSMPYMQHWTSQTYQTRNLQICAAHIPLRLACKGRFALARGLRALGHVLTPQHSPRENNENPKTN